MSSRRSVNRPQEENASNISLECWCEKMCIQLKKDPDNWTDDFEGEGIVGILSTLRSPATNLLLISKGLLDSTSKPFFLRCS